MLCTYHVKNFASFYDRAEFSMLAPNTKVRNRFPDNYTETPCNMDLVKTAVIVGENAGGKSNFITSLKYLKLLFFDTQNKTVLRQFINYNNLTNKDIDKCDSKQEYYLEVVIDNLIYCYTLKIDYYGVVEESLFTKQKRHNIGNEIFSSTRTDINRTKIENKTKISLSYEFNVPGMPIIENSIIETNKQSKTLFGLYITKLAILGYDYAANFVNWVNNTLFAETVNLNYCIYKDFQREEDDLRILHDEKFIDILRMVDYSITSINVDDKKPFSETLIVRRSKDGKELKEELAQDSSGVSEFFAWAVQIFRVVYENKVVFADEMDRVLNPILSERIVSFINSIDHQGQFIFSTHNVLHLNLKNYMKEQIYFVTKDRNTLNSEMYSLADFTQVRYETSKIYEFYMKGILGGTAFE